MSEANKPKELTTNSKVMLCSCGHAWQDSIYGKGKRVHNATKKIAGITQQYRCTVCGAERG